MPPATCAARMIGQYIALCIQYERRRPQKRTKNPPPPRDPCAFRRGLEWCTWLTCPAQTNGRLAVPSFASGRVLLPGGAGRGDGPADGAQRPIHVLEAARNARDMNERRTTNRREGQERVQRAPHRLRPGNVLDGYAPLRTSLPSMCVDLMIPKSIL